MVPEIFAFLGTDTARPDFEITTFIFGILKKTHKFVKIGKTSGNTLVFFETLKEFLDY